MISRPEMPQRRAPSASPSSSPSSTVANGTPRAVWVCGSKKISAWTTPSAAAELVTPDQQELVQRLLMLQGRLQRAIQQRLTTLAHRFVLLQRSLHHQHPERRLQQQQQRLDEAQARLQHALQLRLTQARHRQERLAERLRLSSPLRRLQEAKQRLQRLQQGLSDSWQHGMAQRHQRQQLLAARLETLSPLSTLARGYSITRNQAGGVIRSVADVTLRQRLNTRLPDGKIVIVVEKIVADQAEGSS